MESISRLDLELLKEKFENGEAFEKALVRVKSGEPLAYVIGEWYFYGRTFKLNRECLIPRPDTEHTVEKTVSLLPENGRFADLCTGSGCIAVSVLAERPDLTAYALDISKKALEAAAENARLNGTRERIRFQNADLLHLDASELEGAPFDAIISNPPYIETEVLSTLEVAKSEPVIALDGGSDGMLFYDHILKKLRPALKRTGVFIFEIGYDQAKKITALANGLGLECEIFKDYGGCDRVAVIQNR